MFFRDDLNVFTWNPVTTAFDALATPTGHRLFCSGHGMLADDRLLVVGGHNFGGIGSGHNRASLYDIVSNTWTPLPNMNAGRWYPTQLMLSNGQVLVLAGTQEDAVTQNPLPQVWQPASGTWRDLTNATKTFPHTYPKAFLVSNGRVFVADTTATTSEYLDASGTGSWSGPVATNLHGDRMNYHSSAVMYAWGKILWAGGGHPVTGTAEIIDANATNPAWQSTGTMITARGHFNLTLLPDGKVLATGGDDGMDPPGPVLTTELWDPATGAWTEMAQKAVFHGYHSTALLVPDGRVFSGGGDPEESKFIEVYSPPYLFKGARPAISSAPASIAPGQTYFVGTPDAANITKVSLLATGSVTHGQNMSQRYDTLSFTQTSGGLNVTIPPGDSRTPPGHYLLFILNGNGVPSIGAITRRPAS